MDYMQPSVGGIHSAIRKLVIAANNFEIKSGMLQMIKSFQFGGLATEDPKEYILNFVKLCETLSSLALLMMSSVSAYFRSPCGMAQRVG